MPAAGALLAAWAARAVGERGTSLPEGVRERLQIHVLDSLGALVAGHGTTEGRRILSFGQPDPSGPAIFGDGFLDRIAIRTALVRHTEIDDIDIASCVTPAAVAITSALTLAEELRTTPRAFAAAILQSYRVMTDLGRAAGGSALLHKGFWPTYVVAPLGAAAATAELLALDETRTAHALALALSQTAAAPGGPAEPNPRWLLMGLAARSGVAAALAAARGVPGDPTLLDGDWLAKCHGIEIDRSLLDPPDPDVMSRVSIKPFASAKQAIAGVDAFRRVCAAHAIAPAAIRAVRAHVLPDHLRMIGHDRVAASRSGRLTSLPHLIALAALDPERLMDIERAPADTEAIAALRARVTVAADSSLTAHLPSCWPARVEVELESGGVFSHTVVAARGDPGDPLSLDEAKAKFAAAARSAPAERLGELLAQAARLSAVAGADPAVADWIASCRPAGPRA